MTPQSKSIEQQQGNEEAREDLYIRQVEDHSRPAQDVLHDARQEHEQSDRRAPEDGPALFVP